MGQQISRKKIIKKISRKKKENEKKNNVTLIPLTFSHHLGFYRVGSKSSELKMGLNLCVWVFYFFRLFWIVLGFYQIGPKICKLKIDLNLYIWIFYFLSFFSSTRPILPSRWNREMGRKRIEKDWLFNPFFNFPLTRGPKNLVFQIPTVEADLYI